MQVNAVNGIKQKSTKSFNQNISMNSSVSSLSKSNYFMKPDNVSFKGCRVGKVLGTLGGVLG